MNKKDCQIMKCTISPSTTENNVLSEECSARESWDRKNKQRKSKSYLIPNPHLKYLDINNTRSLKSLPILKNGSRFKELKSCKAQNISGKVILSNTCAFDTVASLIMVAYCDSKRYAEKVDIQNNQFLNFITNVVKYGIKSSTYSERANLIINYMDVNTQSLDYDVTLAVCDTTAGHVIKKMLDDFPTAIETKTCSNEKCIRTKNIQNNIMFLTYQVNSSKLFEGLQTYLDNRSVSENSKCIENCNSVISTNLSDMHLFIDILFWEEDDLNMSNQQSTEAAKIVQIRLCDIPQILCNVNRTFELRGVISFIPGKSKLRNSVGHYKSYVKRGASNNWEIFDDLKKKPIPVKNTTKVNCEFLFYTI
ncbi:unnamed protein product [Aphis gossypii]|uniref:NOF-FB transposable element protein n=1 Tax=Aphis gossypii TaxID=80765 RepID=A0A9P0J0Q2_APHGO|nr:unnamed protein product [Aphis gossypii]